MVLKSIYQRYPVVIIMFQLRYLQSLEDLPVAHIMTTKELSRYLKLHEITICKYAAAGAIPAIRIGGVWRFDKDVIDDWIRTGQNESETDERPQRKGVQKKTGKKKSRKIKV